MGIKITDIKQGSLLYRHGIRSGDILEAINGKKDFDIIDYMMAAGDAVYTLDIKDGGNATNRITIQNDSYEPTGASFESMTINNVKHCSNRCVFCFMDQMPKGMRSTLYFKDDDYRLSFLEGNYVTLTNLNDSELKRIAKLKLSPINISVHTTNPQLRCEMTGNPNAGRIMEQLEFLKNNGISMNLQLVLCPKINDGKELERSLTDILTLGGAVNSLSCVPVGITKYRDGLHAMRCFEKDEALRVIEIIGKAREKATDGQTFCASDEFFILAGKKIPDDGYYGSYEQYENGVGMMRSFSDDLDECLESGEYSDLRASATLVTGKLAKNFIRESIEKINRKTSSSIELADVENNYFGNTITVAGLLTGSDLMADERLKRKTLIIPSNMLKDDEDVFLDDVSVEGLGKELNAKIHVCAPTGAELMEVLKEIRRK